MGGQKAVIQHYLYCKNIRNAVSVGSIEDYILGAQTAVRPERDIGVVVLFRQVGKAGPLEPLCLGSPAQNIGSLDV